MVRNNRSARLAAIPAAVFLKNAGRRSAFARLGARPHRKLLVANTATRDHVETLATDLRVASHAPSTWQYHCRFETR